MEITMKMNKNLTVYVFTSNDKIVYSIISKASKVEHLALTYLYAAGVQGQYLNYNYPRKGVIGSSVINSALNSLLKREFFSGKN